MAYDSSKAGNYVIIMFSGIDSITFPTFSCHKMSEV